MLENALNKTFTIDKADSRCHVDFVLGDASDKTRFQSQIEFDAWGEDKLTFTNEYADGGDYVWDSTKACRTHLDFDEEWQQTNSILHWRTWLKKPLPNSRLKYRIGGNWRDFLFAKNDDNHADYAFETFAATRPGPFNEIGDLMTRWTTNGPEGKEIHECPQRMHDSIEVVHKTKRNNQYGTGKLCTIFKPSVRDKNGMIIGQAVSIDVVGDELIVTLPDGITDSASEANPILINGTEFGYHTVGGYWTNWNKNQARFGGGPYACNGGTLNYIEAYMQGYGGDEDFVAATYPDGGSNDPSGSSPVGVSTAVTIGVSDPAAWVQFNSTGTLTSANQWPTLWHGGDHNQGQIAHAWNTGAQWYDASTSMPDPAAATYLNAFQFSIYGDYTESGGTTHDAAAQITGTGSLAATGTLERSVSSVISAVGGLGVTGNRVQPAASVITGTGGLVASGNVARPAAVVITGLGGLVADAKRVRSISTVITGTGGLTASADKLLGISAVISATGGLIADAQRVRNVSTIISALGGLIASAQTVSPGGQTHDAAAMITGLGSLTASASLIRPISAVITGLGGLSSTGSLIRPISTVITGIGGLIADATVVSPSGTTHDAAAVITALGGLIVVPNRVRPASSSMSATASLVAAVERLLGASVVITASGQLVVSGQRVRNVSTVLAGQSSIVADVERIRSVATIIQAVGGLSANATTVVFVPAWAMQNNDVFDGAMVL